LKLTVLASTHFEDLPDSVIDTEFGRFHKGEPFNSSERVAHFAGRSCYQSWQMPNINTATDYGYIGNIIAQRHFSVLEHASVTFYAEGVSRNMTHELIRHRCLSYSELSQRFVDMSNAYLVVPPAVRDAYREDDPNLPVNGMQPLLEEESDAYSVVVDNLSAMGKSRKEAREAARFYLPSGMETRIVVTGNHRAWREMLQKRYSVHADAEIREFAALVLTELRRMAPAIYQDFPDQPFD
jgi:thymidylate synthase (FAD)